MNTPYAAIPTKPLLEMTATVRCPEEGCGWSQTVARGVTQGEPLSPPGVGREWAAHWHAAHDQLCKWTIRDEVGSGRCVLPEGHHRMVPPVTKPWLKCKDCGQSYFSPIHVGDDHGLGRSAWVAPA